MALNIQLHKGSEDFNKKIALLKKTFVFDTANVAVPRGNTINPHECCATIRHNMERVVMANMTADLQRNQSVAVVDVGGNPLRTQSNLREIVGRNREFQYWAQTPIVGQADHHRQRNPNRVGDCRHKMFECFANGQCWRRAGWKRPEAVLRFWFTDSIYYIDLQELLAMLIATRGVAYGCSHDLPDEAISVTIPSDEVTEGFAVVREGQVSMTVNGNSYTYNHPAFSVPEDPILGTRFNSRYGMRDYFSGEMRHGLNNWGFALSFARLYKCGTYAGWRAMAIPSETVMTIAPKFRNVRVSKFTAECLAMRVTKPEEVRVVVTKMVSRNRENLDNIPMLVETTLTQLDAIGHPVLVSAGSTVCRLAQWCKNLCRPREEEEVDGDAADMGPPPGPVLPIDQFLAQPNPEPPANPPVPPPPMAVAGGPPPIPPVPVQDNRIVVVPQVQPPPPPGPPPRLQPVLPRQAEPVAVVAGRAEIPELNPEMPLIPGPGIVPPMVIPREPVRMVREWRRVVARD